MAETQTCGRRMREFGPWKREEGLDTWQTDRWALTQEENDARVAEMLARSPNMKTSGSFWHGPGPAPRTCSFCGGVNPEDAIVLMRDHGWEVEATGKNYKRYLNPPGCKGYHAVWMQASMDARTQGLMGDDATAYIRSAAGERPWSPVPPVKLYVQHFDEDQADRFNAVLRAPESEEGGENG